ncbi:MAG: MurR/RpiR family transcriptional regulator [Mesorhizobium sp.]|uniref:Sugar isomerase n=2 Tax=Mesorhizobium TaxID=68287 RepID=A0AB36RAJ3_9HYPH|nr:MULTISPECIES: MurR/RpiR family transcriptional regulator [Mesorhizobium]PAQ01479.1 sugar isomerase [Mesorhizobium mediterraneum]RUU26125.1 MurR/RpiR family transcriptional regulator [Mesorhizobium sp. M6A.T.Ce.TU.016.01.1.1]RUU43750.1 MurR/RpiR family transcriptional regulator [Mesorhizobium sp. M6A.T.Ce.TU.002.03.1.1]RWN39230.1 MAG: MurR/RpiR family transcriptional regulator [Mesorhizobium sp.]RWN43052.1 MAG: MurR/RpiR family transcriptional regulator [Mesorhizobium sp.]
MSIREELAHTTLVLTSAEAKIVQVLLADYPMSGLGTASRLAKAAGVSDPTVMRLMVKLGYGGFAAFQAKLLAEIESRLHSPLLMMEAKRPANSSEGTVNDYFHSVSDSLERTRTAVPSQSYGRAARMLLDCKGQVVLLGGRFSRHIASMLAGYLVQFRPGVHDIGALAPTDFDLLIDLGKRDLLVVFDYRRYQSDVVSFARQARERGMGILLFTDPWLSPISEHADLTLIAAIEANSPFDTLATAVVQMETVFAHALESEGQTVRKRIEDIEGIRRANGVTLDASDFTGPGDRRTVAGDPAKWAAPFVRGKPKST